MDDGSEIGLENFLSFGYQESQDAFSNHLTKVFKTLKVKEIIIFHTFKSCS